MDLPLFSAAFAALAITLYVMLDGFDLGVGALLLTEPDENLRDQMIDSIMPMWDGNETWLVMTGVTLLAAFPVAYGILMPAFYLPLSSSDGIYGAGSNLLRPVGTTKDTYEGSQAQVTFDWQLDAHTHFQINYLHFFVGGYLKDTSPAGKDLDFVTTSIQYLF